MKKIFYFIPLVLVLLASCSKAELERRIPLTIHASDAGFVAEDWTTAYPKTFSEGDKIGLFAVKDDGTVESNICLTATVAGSGLEWVASDTSMKYPTAAYYYAYYPYDEGFDAAVNQAQEAEGFFSEYISAWSVPEDQSEGYDAYDLLICGPATIESGVLELEMSHAMSLAVIELPWKLYRFTNTDFQIPDYMLTGEPVFDDFVPYEADGKYLCLVKPGAFSFSGDAAGKPWVFEGNISSGSYVFHSEGESEIIEHQLQIGDFFLADGTLLSKDAPASEVGAAHVIGIVCQYDPERIAEGEREALGGTAHALVLATKTAGGGVLYRFYTDYAIQDTDFDHCYVRDEEGEIGFPRVPQVTDLEELCRLADENIDGYYATHLIYTERAEDLAAGNYPGFKAVQDYAAEVGGPVEGLTTGWFMPAGGQYLDAIRNICDIELDAGNVSPSGSLDGTMTWFNMGTLSNLMNAAMSKVSYSNKTDYLENQNGTMIACEASDDCHRYIDIANQGWVDYMCFWKFTTTLVRPMLAF